MKKHTSRPSRDSSEDSDAGQNQKKGGARQAPAKKVVHDSSDSEAEANDYRRKNSDSDAEENPRVASTANRTATSDGDEDEKKEVFIKSLSYDVDEDDLNKIFGKYGTMTKCKLIQQNGRSRGIAFVEYDNAASAKKAVDAENGSTHKGREISVEFSGNKKQGESGPAATTDNAESNCVFCGNISFNTSEDSVRDFFQKAGDITSVRIAMGEDGRARGFCHIEFASHAMAQEALKLNGQDLDGRAVRLDLSGARKPGFGGGRGGSSFGGGRGRGGFGDRDRGGRGGFGGGRGFGDRGGRGGFGGGRGGSSYGGDRDRRGGFGDRGGSRGRGGDRGGFRKSY